MDSPKFLTAVDAAGFLGISRASFWRHVANGRLPAPFYPTPKAPRWAVADLIAATERNRALPREAMANRRAARLSNRAA